MVLVLLLTCTGNQEVIYVVIAKMQAQQNFVNEPLKGLRCIPESERHLEVDFRENSRAGEGRGEEYVV